MHGYDPYNAGYRDGFKGAPPKEPKDGDSLDKNRYRFGYQDGRVAAVTDWRYANHDQALATSETQLQDRHERPEIISPVSEKISREDALLAAAQEMYAALEEYQQRADNCGTSRFAQTMKQARSALDAYRPDHAHIA